MTHRYHPDPALGEQKMLLYDDCETCEQHGLDPVGGLDDERLRDLYALAVAVEHRDDGHYRSHNEARAARQVWRVALFLERLVPSVDPWTLKPKEVAE